MQLQVTLLNYLAGDVDKMSASVMPLREIVVIRHLIMTFPRLNHDMHRTLSS